MQRQVQLGGLQDVEWGLCVCPSPIPVLGGSGHYHLHRRKPQGEVVVEGILQFLIGCILGEEDSPYIHL